MWKSGACEAWLAAADEETRRVSCTVNGVMLGQLAQAIGHKDQTCVEFFREGKLSMTVRQHHTSCEHSYLVRRTAVWKTRKLWLRSACGMCRARHDSGKLALCLYADCACMIYCMTVTGSERRLRSEQCGPHFNSDRKRACGSPVLEHSAG